MFRKISIYLKRLIFARKIRKVLKTLQELSEKENFLVIITKTEQEILDEIFKEKMQKYVDFVDFQVFIHFPGNLRADLAFNLMQIEKDPSIIDNFPVKEGFVVLQCIYLYEFSVSGFPTFKMNEFIHIGKVYSSGFFI